MISSIFLTLMCMILRLLGESFFPKTTIVHNEKYWNSDKVRKMGWGCRGSFVNSKLINVTDGVAPSCLCVQFNFYNGDAGTGSKWRGTNTLSGSVLQRFCPCLMHLTLDLCSVVDVSIMQEALSFPHAVNVKYLSFVYLVRENSGLEKPNH